MIDAESSSSHDPVRPKRQLTTTRSVSDARSNSGSKEINQGTMSFEDLWKPRFVAPVLPGEPRTQRITAFCVRLRIVEMQRKMRGKPKSKSRESRLAGTKGIQFAHMFMTLKDSVLHVQGAGQSGFGEGAGGRGKDQTASVSVALRVALFNKAKSTNGLHMGEALSGETSSQIVLAAAEDSTVVYAFANTPGSWSLSAYRQSELAK